MVTIKNALSKKNISSFYREAYVCFLIDLSILLVSWMMYMMLIYNAPKDLIYIITFSVLYMIIVGILHYRIAVLQFFDILKNDYIVQNIEIVEFKLEDTFAGDRLLHSKVGSFYPKDICADRYKLYFIDNNNNENFTRMIMSKKDRIILYNLINKNKARFKIVYLRRSKVLLSFDIGTVNDSSIKNAIHELNWFL